MDERPLDLWNNWAIQILVLLSFTLQVILLFFAGIRRHEASTVKKSILWLAYQLADSTAIYTIGHLSFCGLPHEHQLVLFWAPFLLLHLGGPDNITAYALQDNQLWQRHLLTLLVQVLGAGYVLYKHVIVASDDPYLRLAALLMFAVGLVKYAERTWALRCSNLDRIRSSLKKDTKAKQTSDSEAFFLCDQEETTARAHSLLYISKCVVVDYPMDTDPQNPRLKMLQALIDEDHWKVWHLMEIELSLMYDILYTKAAVVHTWFGYVMRLLSLLAAAASLILFQICGKDAYSRVDVAVTYALLAGAFLLETWSLFRALGSSWTYAFLRTTPWRWIRCVALCSGMWHRLHWFVNTVTNCCGKRSPRRWSGKMGQYNMMHVCSHRARGYIPLHGRLASVAEWCLKLHCSGTVEISDYLKKMLFMYVKRRKRDVNAQGVIRKNWGQAALQQESKEFYRYFKDQQFLGAEFQECILIWHIATDIFLAKISITHSADEKAVRTLSNYMMFLLVHRRYMLPGLDQSMLYRLTCKNLAAKCDEKVHNRQSWNICMMLKELFCDYPKYDGGFKHIDNNLASILFKDEPEQNLGVPRLYHAYHVSQKLLEMVKQKGSMAVLKLLLDVWMDFVVYAANRCSRESHAKKLSNGGELTTVMWFITDFIHRGGLKV